MTSPYIDEYQTIIAVMGTTGVGKSTFINYATNGGAQVGENLTACTANCAAYLIPETNVWLIDTPGFDDTFRSDAKILEEINGCLSEYFQKEAKVKGVIYVHAITEPRMRGSSMKNLRMFRQVVGDSNMAHCCLVTTKWSKQSVETSKGRIAELQTDDNFWKPLLKMGASIKQFNDSTMSAWEIIRPLTMCKRFHMKLVWEYNVQGKDLDQTDAGREVFDDIEAAKKAHEKELELLREEWDEALNNKDKEMAEMIAKEKIRVQKEMEEMKLSQERLHKKYAEEKKALEEKLELDRQIRQRDRANLTGQVWRGVARTGAIAAAGTAVFFSAGVAAPAAIYFLACVEESLQESKAKQR